MSSNTLTQNSSRTQSRIELEDAERFAGGERSDPAGRADRRRGLSQELVDGAIDQARLRTAVGRLVGEEARGRVSDEVIDELLAGARTEEEIVGPGGLLAQLTKRLVERAMDVELTEHLGFEPHQEPPGGAGNTRNGSTPKTLVTDNGPVPIDTPRDRNGSFEPKIVRKRQRRFQGFDEKILALYSRGLSTRDIEAHLHEMYGVNVGRDLISRVTDAVMDDVRDWAKRPLEDVYPVSSTSTSNFPLARRSGSDASRGRTCRRSRSPGQ